jgi:hypothetical protein
LGATMAFSSSSAVNSAATLSKGQNTCAQPRIKQSKTITP